MLVPQLFLCPEGYDPAYQVIGNRPVQREPDRTLGYPVFFELFPESFYA